MRENLRPVSGRRLNRRRLLALSACVGVGALGLALAGCGSGGDDGAPAASAQPSQAAADAAEPEGYRVAPAAQEEPAAQAEAPGREDGAAQAADVATRVRVDEHGFRLGLDMARVPEGSVTFAVRNFDGETHQFLVIRTDLPADALPLGENRFAVDEEAAGLTVVGKILEIAQGQTQEATLDLPVGRYVLICNVPGHYSLGMFTEFEVVAAAASAN